MPGSTARAAQELRAQVGRDNECPVLVGNLQETLVATYAGALVDQDIDVAECRGVRGPSMAFFSLRRAQ